MPNRFGIMRQASELGRRKRDTFILDNTMSQADRIDMVCKTEARIARNKNVLEKQGQYMSEKQKQSYERCIQNDMQFVARMNQQLGR